MLPTIPEALWRKSSQWVELTRPHAMRIAEDAVVDGVIKKHCTVGYDRKLRRYSRRPARHTCIACPAQSAHCWQAQNMPGHSDCPERTLAPEAVSQTLRKARRLLT